MRKAGKERAVKLLTVAVPSYNVEKTLKASLESLCVEEIMDKLEVIVVDDGSKDTTAAIAQSFVDNFPGTFKLLRKENGGHGSTVNTALEAATGRYFKVMDGDDRLTREGLMALTAEAGHGSADLIASNYLRVPADGSQPIKMEFSGVEYGRLYRFGELRPDGLYFGIHGSTFRTEILRKSGLKLQEHTFYVDTEYALLPIPFVQTVVFIPEFVYLYAVGNAGQSVDAVNFVKRYEDHYRVVRRLSEFAALSNPADPGTEYIYRVMEKLCFTNYMLGCFYDSDSSRGRARAREFDAWLKSSNKVLYSRLGHSTYIKFLRFTGFHIVIRGMFIKKAAKKIFGIFKRITGKRRFTY